jgi:hypothetical protein
VIQNALSLLALSFALWLIVGNWYCVLIYLFRSRHSSWVPVLGGALGSIGCLASPHPELNGVWWLPLLLDWGTIPGIVFSTFCYIIGFLRRRSR